MHSIRSVVRRGIKGNGGHSSAFDKSLNESLSAEYPDGDTRLDFLASECPSPEDNVISSLEVVRATQTMVQVSQLIPKMNKLRRSQIMELCSDLWRSRIYSETPDSLEEVAGRHGISRETARKIEGRLLTRVRTALKENP
jgi:DNA-directed RNA polymerase sigma subunit (sigma70/sigma32)